MPSSMTLNKMTLNDLERLNSHYFAVFSELDSFAGQLRHSG